MIVVQCKRCRSEFYSRSRKENVYDKICTHTGEYVIFLKEIVEMPIENTCNECKEVRQ